MTQTTSPDIVLYPNICGDHWINPEEMQSDLDRIFHIHDTTTPIVLKINSEGPSLRALGIVDVLLDHCQRTQRLPQTIFVLAWSNAVEQVPFSKIGQFSYSHFFWMSKKYWDYDSNDDTRENRIGFFMGRRTLPRKLMLYDLWWMDRDLNQKNFLLSLMNQSVPIPARGIQLDDPQQWLRDTPEDQFRAWWNSPPVDSLDSASINDQYDGKSNTNLSLLRFYHRFGLELVGESYCHGEAFFMTEKTIRPIVGSKPMLVQGPRLYLHRFRDLGFRTWKDIWDESYDDLCGYERWCKLKQQIRIFASMSHDEFWSLMEHAKDICRHNLQHLKTLVLEHSPQ